MAGDKPEDDDFEDAAFDDLDAIEDEDDLGDDSWDDLDDPAAEHPVITDAPENGAVEALPGQKTFVQKNFMIIVVGIVLVFGGGIVLSFLGRGSPAPVNETATTNGQPGGAIAESEASSEMPPMPAPIDSQPGASADTTAAGDPLTPMPTPQDLQDTKLAELNVEEVPATPVGAPQDSIGQTPFDYNQNNKPAETSPPSAEKAVSSPPASIAEAAAPPLAPAPDLSPRLEEQARAVESLKTDINAKIQTIESKLSDLNSETRDTSQSMNTKLTALSESVEKLQKQIADLASRQASVASAPASAQESESEIPASAPKKTSVPRTAVESTDQIKSIIPENPVVAPPTAPVTVTAEVKKPSDWVMKSAQPGRAVLSSKSTGDMKTVVIGDEIQGLGKITFIGLVEGRWTVQGTTGKVSR